MSATWSTDLLASEVAQEHLRKGAAVVRQVAGLVAREGQVVPVRAHRRQGARSVEEPLRPGPRLPRDVPRAALAGPPVPQEDVAGRSVRIDVADRGGRAQV